jgi:hypothetical protein
MGKVRTRASGAKTRRIIGLAIVELLWRVSQPAAATRHPSRASL